MGRGLAHHEKMFWVATEEGKHLPHREQMYYMYSLVVQRSSLAIIARARRGEPGDEATTCICHSIILPTTLNIVYVHNTV